MNGLFFEQKFPYTERAKNHLKQKKILLEDVSEEEIKKALILIIRAHKEQDYLPEITNPDKENCEKEVIAFPTAKLLLSAMNITGLEEKFSDLFRKKTMSEILSEKDLESIALELADDFGIKYELCEKDFFLKIILTDYLENYFRDEESKLVNKHVEKGFVYMNTNDFARFLSEKAFKKIIDSLPIKKESIPKNIQKIARNASSQLRTIQQKNYNQKISAKINTKNFPPSMLELYNRQLGGEKLGHYERLTIALFLRQIGMNKGEMLSFFSKSPDYKKHVAEYHVDRIFEKELSAPSFKKMDDYGINITLEEKKYSHPVRYYLAKTRANNRKKNFKGEKNV